MRVVKAQLYNTLKNWSTWIILAIFMWGQIENITDKENLANSLFERNLIFFRIGNTEICALIFSILVIGKIIKNNYIKNIKNLYENKEKIVVANTAVSLIYVLFLYAVNFVIDIIFKFVQKQSLGNTKELGELLSYIPLILCTVIFTSIIMMVTKSTLLGLFLGYAFLSGKDLLFMQMNISNNIVACVIVAIVISCVLLVLNRIIAKRIYSVA
ncbi:hypothetical protein SAMN04487761_101111 [Lachnospiraceae bacterium C7]|nr:hypothetical protein SAMN04487761_101111 [Lachnospiraceae bacterium C7]